MDLEREGQFPESPVEMAAWVRDRAMKMVEQLSVVVEMTREQIDLPEEAQSSLHFALSGALANSIKLTAFASGYHLTADELSELVGRIYEEGSGGCSALAAHLATMDEPLAAIET